MPSCGIVRRKDDGDIEHQLHLNETRTNSETGKADGQAGLTPLAHHIDVNWLREAYRLTRKTGAVGVDGQTVTEYAANLEENLQSLLNRAKSGDSYRAPPVRRVRIPKGDGKKTRPFGIPSFEDKVLQRAVAMVLTAAYEQEFLDCSHGFRPGRSPHEALRAVWKQTMDLGDCWVLEADIEDFFGSVERTQLRQVLSQRIRDGVLLRLIGKWLNAGVMEEGCLYHPETDVLQGGVISPILSNIFLHDVLDLWFERTVKPRLGGVAHLTRFADDFVMVFDSERDARRVQAVLAKRFAKYGLRLHPGKTKLTWFRAPTSQEPKDSTKQRERSFDLLGFTFYWGLSRKKAWVVKQKTRKSGLRKALLRISVLVQSEQARAGERTATSAGSKAARALFLLRDNGEFPRAQSPCLAGATPMALLAGATLESRNAVGPHACDPESVPASGASRRSLGVQGT